MKIQNRTFIVSGGSSGLGLATVRELIKAEAYVVNLDQSPPPEEPDFLPSSARIGAGSSGGSSEASARFLYIETNVADEDQIRDALARTMEWTKQTGAVLGGVLNCAGMGRTELIIGKRNVLHSTQLWDLTLAVNLTGTFNLTRLALEHLVHVPPEDGPEGERGVVVMVSSEAAYEGQPGQTAYAATKGALRSMTLPMARDLARHNIRVVTLAPGPFTTPLTGQFPDRIQKGLHEKGLLFPRRYGFPREFAETVKWILECGYVNGETIRLTGGGRIPAWL